MSHVRTTRYDLQHRLSPFPQERGTLFPKWSLGRHSGLTRGPQPGWVTRASHGVCNLCWRARVRDAGAGLRQWQARPPALHTHSEARAPAAMAPRQRRPPSPLLCPLHSPSIPPPLCSYAREVEYRVGLFWRVAAQPLLFGIIGTLVDLRTVSGGIIPRALAIVAVGGCAGRAWAGWRVGKWAPLLRCVAA